MYTKTFGGFNKFCGGNVRALYVCQRKNVALSCNYDYRYLMYPDVTFFQHGHKLNRLKLKI